MPFANAPSELLGLRHRLRAALVVAAALLIASCAFLSSDGADETRDWTAKRLYNEAGLASTLGDYEKAIDLYQKLEARYPFGGYAQQGQLELAYAYHKFSEPDSALAAAERFLKLHPRHPNADYAYYLKGIVNFNRDRGFLAQYIPPADHHRDMASALDAFRDFSTLVEHFPDSRYGPDARQRMLYLRNTVAQHELVVAGYYMRREAYVAAANRAKYVVENFPTTPAIPDALTIMATAYLELGLNDLASAAIEVLRLNHPDHDGLLEVEARVSDSQR